MEPYTDGGPDELLLCLYTGELSVGTASGGQGGRAECTCGGEDADGAG